MADRYWVGGTGFWDNISGLKWAATSGGTPGVSVPTTSDTVYFDANSGAGTISIAAGNTGCDNFICTGYTGTVTGNDPITIRGGVFLSAGMTWSYAGTMTLTNGAVLNSAGKVFAGNITISGATIQLTNNLQALTLTLNNGSFWNDSYNVTLNNFISNNNSLTRTLHIGGGGTWTITGSGNVWDCTTAATNLTVIGSMQGGVIKFTSTGSKDFYGGGQYWPVLENGGTGELNVYGNNYFDEIKNSVSPAIFRFASGSTQTVDIFNVNGSAGNLVSILASSTSRATLSKSSGTVSANYCQIKDSNATGGAQWNAISSTDSGNNVGWNFYNFSSNAFMQFF
jgi:hypothetical protein